MSSRQFMAAAALAVVVFGAAFAGAALGVRWNAARTMGPGAQAEVPPQVSPSPQVSRTPQVTQPPSPSVPITQPTAPTPKTPADPPAATQETVRLIQPAGDANLVPLVKGLDDSVLLGAAGFDGGGDAILPLHFHTQVRPLYLRIGRDHPNGTRFTVYFDAAPTSYFDKVGLPLPVDFDSTGNQPFDEFGYLQVDNGYYIQAGEHDFDGDGEPEIVVAVGTGSLDLLVDVFKYHPPAEPADAGREENWELLGAFEGQQPGWVDGPSLALPYGSFGLYVEETLAKGKFVRTN